MKTPFYLVIIIISYMTAGLANSNMLAAVNYDLATVTATPTQTLISQSETGTPTQNVIPLTSSITPTVTSGTPSQTYTPTTTPSPSATTTLIPLPVVTLIFPKKTPTPSPTITPTVIHEVEENQKSQESKVNFSSPRFRLLSVLVIFLWLILAGFLIVYIRQFK
jgi:hypothetical protein